MKATKNFLTTLVLSLVVGTNVFAQSDLIDETDLVLNGDQIDIDGSFTEQAAEADTTKISNLRKRLERKNDELIQKRIEAIRMNEERKLARKLKRAFRKGSYEDQVSTAQAAPTTSAFLPAKSQVIEEESTVRITPSFGITTADGKTADFDSKFQGGLNVEYILTPRWSVGGSFNYLTMDIVDNSNQFVNLNQFNSTVVNNAFFSQGREMDYDRYSVGAYGKFYILTESKFRPYLGAGAQFNRSQLKYTSADVSLSSLNLTGLNVGSEQYNASYVTGSVFLGSEIKFSNRFGMDVNVSYQSAMKEVQSDATTNQFNPDQIRLQNVGESLENSDFFSVNAGFVIYF